MNSYLHHEPGNGALTHLALERELQAMRDSRYPLQSCVLTRQQETDQIATGADPAGHACASRFFYISQALDWMGWFTPHRDKELHDHREPLQYRFVRTGPGTKPQDNNSQISYRMACGYDALDWHFIGEVCMSEPDGRPGPVACWYSKKLTRKHVISHAEGCQERLKKLHSVSLQALILHLIPFPPHWSSISSPFPLLV